MKRFLAGLLIGTIVACASVSDAGDPNPRYYPDSWTSDGYYDVGWEFHLVDTPFGKIECVWASTGSRSGGPDCNWDKFNKNNED